MLLLAVAVVIDTQAAGDEFRIETMVYVGTQSKPLERRTTLLEETRVIDFQDNASGVANIVDLVTNELILVDEPKKQYAVVSASQMDAFIAAQQARIISKSFDQQQVLLPQLTRSWDAQEWALGLSSPQLTYSATLVKPLSPELEAKYRQFTDWMARYNAIRGWPPAPRLQLNQEMANLSLVPREIRKTVLIHSKRTTHRYHLGWREQDRQRVDQITKSYPQYRERELSEFLR
jgi:hypothetical protein